MIYIERQKYFALILLLLILFSVIVFIIVYNKDRDEAVQFEGQKNNGAFQIPVSYPVSYSTQDNPAEIKPNEETQSANDSSVLENQMKEYTDSNNIFKYSYPNDWTFRDGREGIGLISITEKEKNHPIGEIVTIFTTKTDKSLIDWVLMYDGAGYKIEEERIINGYPAYYIFKESDLLTMQIYVFKKDDNIVRINFRQKDAGSTPDSYDFSEFEDDFEAIVNSIRYI